MQRTARLDGLGSSSPPYLLSLRAPSVDELHLGRALIVLDAWLIVGRALTAVFARGRPHGLSAKVDSDRRRAEAEALIGAGSG